MSGSSYEAPGPFDKGGPPSGSGLLSAKQAQAIAGLSTRISPRMWQSSLPFWGAIAASYTGGTGSGQAGTITNGKSFEVEGPFTAVRLIFANRTTSAVTLPNAIVAVSASNADYVTPRDANNNALSWTPVTQNGGAAITIPAAGDANRCGLALSDIIPLSSLPRSDGGAYPIIMTRCLNPASGAYSVATLLPASLTAYNGLPNARKVLAFFGGGDFVSQSAVWPLITMANAALGTGYDWVIGVQYLSASRIVTIMGSGDSLTCGFQTTSGYNGFGLQAAKTLSQQLGIGVSFVNHGFPGTVDTDYLADAAQALTLLQPQVVTIPSDSPNNYNVGTPTSAAAAAQALAMPANSANFVNTVQAAGALPVQLTPIPFGSTSPYDTATSYGPFRVAIGAGVRASSQRNLLILDAQAIISGYVPGGSVMPQLPPQFVAGDGAHLNDAGQALLSRGLVNLLLPALQ